MKIFVFFSFAARGTKYETFEACIFGGCIGVRSAEINSNRSCLAIEVPLEKILEIQLTCVTHHKMTFSKFDSFDHVFQGIFFYIMYRRLSLETHY